MGLLKPLSRILPVSMVLLLAVSCGSNSPNSAEGESTESAVASRASERASWQLQAGEDAYEGDIAFVTQSGGQLRIQLVNRDGVNLAILLPGEGAAARQAENAYFAIGRGQSCQLVASDPPFQVTVERGGAAWLTGSFSGMLGCADYSALPVKGSFHVPAAGK
jgi:hypothetical protein